MQSHPFGCSFITDTPESIFTVRDFSTDERLMIETAEQFCRREILARGDEIERQQQGLMPTLVRQAGAIGLCGVDSPEQFGGLGLSKTLAARVLEMMSLDASFSVTYGITSGISQIGLALFGSDGQKSRYLPKLASGEWIGAYALSEPNSGSDALSATCRADQVPGGYRLNGTKMWISNALWADVFLVMAKIDGTQFSAFLVDRTNAGLSVAREEHKMGLKGSSTARLILEEVFVPEENLLHEPGKGHQVAFNALNIGRFKLSSMSLGPARRAIELAVAYALERKQFQRPIAEFGLIQEKFATMAALFYVAESLTYRTGALIDGAFDRNESTVEGRRAAAEEFSVECSCSKVFATEAESAIVDEALQVFGGYGFTEEFPIAKIYRDARVSRIYEGTNEINRVFIADRIRKKVGDLTLHADSFVGELLASAWSAKLQHQVHAGALADLTILAYADQSARLAGRKDLYETIRPWLSLKAASAYQTLTGRAVTLPASSQTDWEAVAASVYAARGPL